MIADGHDVIKPDVGNFREQLRILPGYINPSLGHHLHRIWIEPVFFNARGIRIYVC